MSGKLKDRLHDRIVKYELSEQQLESLQAKLRALEPAPTRCAESPVRSWWAFSAVLSVLAVFLAIPVYMQISEQKNSFNLEMAQLIAEEVVKNHLHLKPLEVKSNSLSDIRRYFTQLNFIPVASGLVNSLDTRLLGARYCSLQGITAAQLRLQDHKGRFLNTLYQAEYKKEVFGRLPDIGQDEQPLVAYANGIKVKVWLERDIVFALTEVEDTK